MRRLTIHQLAHFAGEFLLTDDDVCMGIGNYLEATFHGFSGEINSFEGRRGERVSVVGFELTLFHSFIHTDLTPEVVQFATAHYNTAGCMLEDRQFGEELRLSLVERKSRNHRWFILSVNDVIPGLFGRRPYKIGNE